MTRNFSAIFVATLASAVFLLFLPSFAQETKKGKDRILEPVRFWTAIIENDKLEPWQRGIALYLLFERHVDKDATLGKLGEILNKPTWIKENDVRLITRLAGWVPLKLSFEDSTFSIRVFTNSDLEKNNRESIGLYITVSGEIDKATFLSIISNRQRHKNDSRRIKEFAFSPTLEEYTKKNVIPAEPAPR